METIGVPSISAGRDDRGANHWICRPLRFGKVAVTFESHDASEDDRLIYRKSVADALERCVPLPMTDVFGNAIAGDRRPSDSLTNEGKGAPPVQRFSMQVDDHAGNAE
jgi:hypothetical protein